MNQSNTTSLSKKKLPKSAYIGDFLLEGATGPTYFIVMSYILLFYTDYIGLSARDCGIIILISKLMDGISDLIGANIIEHTHTKAGSARPWLLRMALPILVSTVLMFAVPDIPRLGQYIYVFITYNLFCTVVFTMLACVSNTLPSLMTADRQERAVLYVLKMIMSVIFQLVVGFVSMRAVIFLGNDQRAWITVAFAYGFISLASCLIAYRLCPEQIENAVSQKESIPFAESARIVLTNKYFWIMFGVQFVIVLIQTAVLSVGSYYAKYVLGDVRISGNFISLFSVPAVAVMVFLPFLLRYMTKRNVALIGSVLMIFSQIVLMMNGTVSGTYCSLIIKSLGFGLAMATLSAMLSDSVDWAEYKTGKRPTAMTMCGNNIAQKLASGIGNALLGLYLTMSGYDINPTGASSIQAIVNSFVYVPFVLTIILTGLYLTYDLDKKYVLINAAKGKRTDEAASGISSQPVQTIIRQQGLQGGISK